MSKIENTKCGYTAIMLYDNQISTPGLPISENAKPEGLQMAFVIESKGLLLLLNSHK